MLRLAILVFALVLALNGCSQNHYNANLTAMPPTDPSDGLLQSAIQKYLQQNQSPLHSQYEYARVDLNADGLREGIVLFTLPHHFWCTNGGCTMMVFKAYENKFTPLSVTQNVRPPVLVSPIATKGWLDFVLNISGQEDYDKTSVLIFNGTSYPQDAATSPSVPYPLSSIEGTRLFP